MNIEMFIVGGIIWIAYMYFTLWNIWYNSKSAKKNDKKNKLKSLFFSYKYLNQNIK